jgi:two-component system OmpR family sensor kinase
MKTIRTQLLLGLLCATLVCTAGAGAALYYALLEETNELADLQLRQLVVALPGKFGSLPEGVSPHDPEEEYVLQAWDMRGSMRYASRPAAPVPRFNANGFAMATIAGAKWRIFGTLRHRGYVQVAQPMAARDQLAASMALRAGAPLLLFALALVILTLAVVGRALRPLRRLTQAVQGRSPHQLQPLPADGMPPDLQPMILAMNGLLEKFDAALTAQKTFVADAAHELRSPLAALKLQLQLAERAVDADARQLALARLHERLDRATHLVQQLLSLARHEGGHSAGQRAPVDLGTLLDGVVRDNLLLAESRAIDLGIDRPASIVIDGNEDSLRVLLNNLVDNALRYTQAGGRVDLQARCIDGRAALVVADNGPGVAPAHRDRLFDRFFRPEGNLAWGSGLGLAIASNIAAHHGAAITLGEGDGGRGLRVTVTFPRVPGRVTSERGVQAEAVSTR